MATTRFLLGFLCLVTFSCSTEPQRSALKPSALQGNEINGTSPYNDLIQAKLEKSNLLKNKTRQPINEIRNQILTIAISQLGIREATGKNDGKQVEIYLKSTKLGKGNPWCAAFISWVYKQAGLSKPRTAWSPALFPSTRQTSAPEPADLLGIYSLKLKRIAHCGIIERKHHNWVISLEGNTSLTGSREGDGVYRKWRHINTIAKFANWLD